MHETCLTSGGFANDAAFTHDCLVFCVSSIPRWEFARGIRTCKTDVGRGRCGGSDGVHRMISETKCIIAGWGHSSGIPVGGMDEDIARLQTATSTMGALLYACDNSD